MQHRRTDHFINVTEMAGQTISAEQLDRTCHRYHWALNYCRDKHVLEAACGAGQGLGLLNSVAASLVAGDVSPEVLERARETYNDGISLSVFPAEALPVKDGAVDTILLFEAIYYLPDAHAFLMEAKRALRPGGTLLIVTANKDLYDFNPSPFSKEYRGVRELHALLTEAGFDPSFWGYVDIRATSWRQRLMRPLKLIASKLNLIPKTMAGKAFLKRLVFGAMATMPASISRLPYKYVAPEPLDPSSPARHHKVIYCAATLDKRS